MTGRQAAPAPLAERPRLAWPLRSVLGTATANALAKLDLHTVGDLLSHYPRRYGTRGAATQLTELIEGAHVSVFAKVQSASARRNASGGSRLEVIVSDGASRLKLTFFAKKEWGLARHQKFLIPGAEGVFSGVVGQYRGELQLTHPDYLMVGEVGDDAQAAMYEAGRPIPIYPATAKMPTWKIAACVATALNTITAKDLPDPIPPALKERRGLLDRLPALEGIHRPHTMDDVSAARARLRFEEAFVLQAALAGRRARTASMDAIARQPRAGALLEAFDRSLPFTLTPGQIDVGKEISEGLARPHPMQRLLQGEVGSGKTVVALRAMLQVVDAGGQAALLAPTEVLATQHARTLRALLGPLGAAGELDAPETATGVALLTGSLGAAARRDALSRVASGEAGIVVGTHALLSEDVKFADLGLVVVDEQHRFGVEQRDALRAKGALPHLLVMTATPIPRTVAMTVFGDLDTSTLAQVPSGRAGVTTVVVPAENEQWMTRTWQRVREEADAGGRAYVVCARISADDDGASPPASPLAGPEQPARKPLRAVEDVAEELRTLPALAGLAVEVLHGQMSASEKDEVMARFATGKAQVLVATTVIEVGVDVPEATVMVVLDADRFGLSQLHQLRGRVGRGAAPGLCLLVSSAEFGTPASARVEALAGNADGFALAQLDLELRSEGDVLGASQSGRASGLKLLRVLKDAAVIEEARSEAMAVVAQDSTLAEHPVLAGAIATWLDEAQEQFLDRA